jgi:hypothetical protein
MRSRLDRIISIATLLALLVVIGLMLKRSAPVAQQPKASAGIPVSSQSANQKVDQPEPAAKPAQAAPQSQTASGNLPASSFAVQPVPNLAATQSAKAEPHINSNSAEPKINSSEVSAAISQILGASGAGLTPDANVGSGMPNIKDQKVTYDGDTVHGQFLTEIGGKDVWITISGHMGQKDGYATFDPTEFKVGDVDVPVSLVNPALQRKLAEERDRLKVAEPAK